MARWFRKPRARPTLPPRASEDLLRSLALIVEPASLRASIAERVRELTGCDFVIMCAHLPGASAHTAVATTDGENPLPEDLTFAVNGTLGRWLRANQEPFLVTSNQAVFDYLEDSEQQTLSRLNVRACVPIFSGDRHVAILLLCSPRSEWTLTARDQDLLGRLGQQAGLALENAELHQLERDRLKNLHRAEQLAVAGQLAATVAHEIRNPLTAIRSTVQYTLESSTDWESKRRLLEQTLEEVDRIERTVGGVLALSKTSDVAFTDVDLIANVEQSLLIVQAYARTLGVVIERQFEAGAVPVRGDSRALHQVFVNLFMNACQAMPDGGTLKLRCGIWQPSDQSRVMALMQVHDTGHGMTPQQLEQAFNPFFTTKQSGTGLGLPICLDIVSRHGGNLRLDSVEGKGTSATVLLPLRIA